MTRSMGVAACGLALAACVLASAACGGGGGESEAGADWATAKATVDGARWFVIRNVNLELSTGEDGWYRVDGEPAVGGECVPGLSAGMGLYGSLPSSVKTPIDLIGARLPVEFTGDGDDFNLCVPDVGGLMGADDATIAFTSVSGDRAEFTMSGRFTIYDENANPTPATAEVTGTARIRAAEE